MTEASDGAERRREQDARTEALVEGLSAIEDRLDPQPRRTGQRIADLVVVALILLVTQVTGLELRYPAVLIGLLVLGRLSTHAIGSLRDRSLHREREELLAPERSDGAGDSTGHFRPDRSSR